MSDDSNTSIEYDKIETSGAPSAFLYGIFTVSAVLGISGWLLLLSLYIFWMVEPEPLPSIAEPIPVLNQYNEVAIGSTLFMEFDVVKLNNKTPINAARFLECESGNLVTLTSAAITLPVGSYTIVSDDIVIPAKVTPGDECKFVIEVTYQINPLRQKTNRFESESFVILEKPSKKES
jgi:hypothetical protein